MSRRQLNLSHPGVIAGVAVVLVVIVVANVRTFGSVSYTHLTLPTNREA